MLLEYMFHFFDPHNPVLKELGDAKTLANLEQLYPSGAREEAAAKVWLTGGEKLFNLPKPLPQNPITLEPGKAATVELRAVPPQSDAEKSPEVTARFCFKEPPAADETIALKINGLPVGPGKLDGRWIAYSVRPEQIQQGINRFELTLSENVKKKLVLQDLVLIVRSK